MINIKAATDVFMESVDEDDEYLEAGFRIGYREALMNYSEELYRLLQKNRGRTKAQLVRDIASYSMHLESQVVADVEDLDEELSDKWDDDE